MKAFKALLVVTICVASFACAFGQQAEKIKGKAKDLKKNVEQTNGAAKTNAPAKK